MKDIVDSGGSDVVVWTAWLKKIKRKFYTSEIWWFLSQGFFFCLKINWQINHDMLKLNWFLIYISNSDIETHSQPIISGQAPSPFALVFALTPALNVHTSYQICGIWQEKNQFIFNFIFKILKFGDWQDWGFHVKMIQRVFAQNWIRAGSVPLRSVFALTLALECPYSIPEAQTMARKKINLFKKNILL